MERKIGEIFEYNGEWYQCMESPNGNCMHCDIDFGGKCPIPIKECTGAYRIDMKHVIFKKLEKVGEPYVKRVSDGTFSTFQRYRVYNSVILPKEPYIYCNFIDGTIEIELKQTKEDMEGKKLNLKPFDLEAAKLGKPVCTRDGRKARIICFDAKRKDKKSIIALIPSKDYPGFEDLIAYPNDGNYYGGHENDGDLMMLPERKEGWVNVYKDGLLGTRVHNTKKEAFDNASPKDYVATVKIEWEE